MEEDPGLWCSRGAKEIWPCSNHLGRPSPSQWGAVCPNPPVSNIIMQCGFEVISSKMELIKRYLVFLQSPRGRMLPSLMQEGAVTLI